VIAVIAIVAVVVVVVVKKRKDAKQQGRRASISKKPTLTKNDKPVSKMNDDAERKQLTPIKEEK